MWAQVVCVSFGQRRSGKRRKKDPAYPPGDRRARQAGTPQPEPRRGESSRGRGEDYAAQTAKEKRCQLVDSQPGDLHSQHGPPRFSMVLSAETRNLPCAPNHCLIKEPFSSAAGLQLNTPKVVGTFRFRCSGLLGYDASRRISFGWNSSLPPETPLRTCAMSGLFSAVFATSDWRTDIV